MSAVPVDDLLVEEFLAATPVRLRLLPGGAGADVDDVASSSAAEVAAVMSRTSSGSGSLRLTNRGIAVILGAFATLFATGVAVAVTSFLSVSEAPVAHPVAGNVVR